MFEKYVFHLHKSGKFRVYRRKSIMGDAMLKLIDVQSNNKYQPRAIVLKEKKRYPDIVAVEKTN
jgi:hypothetical protein